MSRLVSRLVSRRVRPIALGLAVLLLLSTLLAGCRSAAVPDSVHVRVVATTTILADLVHQVGGPLVSVESLVPKGGEVHTFDPKPSDVRRLVEADLVVRNGLGLDDWLANLVKDSGATAPIVALGEDLPGVEYITENGVVNPHLWLNVAYVRAYVARIADALATASPGDASAFRAGAAAYDATLATLDAEIHTQLAAIPEANRTVVAFHDAFPYFAAAYGLTIDGTIVNAPGQDPSASQVAALVRAINAGGIKAIFSEAQFNPALAKAIAAETTAVVVTDLYTDSTGDPPLDSYVAIMRWDAGRVAEALTTP